MLIFKLAVWSLEDLSALLVFFFFFTFFSFFDIVFSVVSKFLGLLLATLCMAILKTLTLVSYFSCSTLLFLSPKAITSIITRKKELGMLQAIGLTNKQLVQMLNKEAMFYTSFMLIGSLTIGNIIGYSAVQAMRKSGMSYAVYVLPINQMIIMIVCIVLAQFILTYLISKNFNKESLIDRVRYSE